ncbi:unnamed protein product, partial [Chrysoparadoxa australica]
LLGSQPNRQHLLYFFRARGSAFNIFFVRFCLVVQALYISVLLSTFVPEMFAAQPLWQGTLYLVLGLLPLLYTASSLPRLVEHMVHANSIGCLRNMETCSKVT